MTHRTPATCPRASTSAPRERSAGHWSGGTQPLQRSYGTLSKPSHEKTPFKRARGVRWAQPCGTCNTRMQWPLAAAVGLVGAETALAAIEWSGIEWKRGVGGSKAELQRLPAGRPNQIRRVRSAWRLLGCTSSSRSALQSSSRACVASTPEGRASLADRETRRRAPGPSAMSGSNVAPFVARCWERCRRGLLEGEPTTLGDSKKPSNSRYDN